MTEVSVFDRSRFEEPFQAEIPERIDTEVPFDLPDRHSGGNEFFLRRHVNTIETGMADGGRSNPQMYFFRAGCPKHVDQFPGCSTSHDRVVNHDHTFFLQDSPDRIELDSHVEISDLLKRMDEGSSDVVIPDETDVQRHSQFLGISESSRIARVRYGDDQIRLDRMFPGKFVTVSSAGEIGILAEDDTVRP